MCSDDALYLIIKFFFFNFTGFTKQKKGGISLGATDGSQLRRFKDCSDLMAFDISYIINGNRLTTLPKRVKRKRVKRKSGERCPCCKVAINKLTVSIS